VLAAVPVEAAGGASGLFGTAQQLGGAVGVAVFGTVFFGYLSGHSFAASMVHTAPYAIGAFALCAVLALLLPRTAVSEEALTESWPRRTTARSAENLYPERAVTVFIRGSGFPTG
jgi:hypothetical protein